MASEAINRDQNFRSGLGYPSLVWDVLHFEYGMRSKLWKEAMFGGLQWVGVPGLRGIGLGANRNIKTGGFFNKAGINVVNKPVHSLLSQFEWYRAGKYNFAEKGLTTFGGFGGTVGRGFGGNQTSLLKVATGKASREAVSSTLEKNWFKALFSEKIAASRTTAMDAFGAAPGLKRPVSLIPGLSFKEASKLGTRKTAAKFALSQRFIPAAVWASNLAFAASITMPLFSAAGRFVGGQIEGVERFVKTLNTRQLDFGGKIHQSYMNRAGLTERQRALSELQKSRTNARTLMGNEAQLYHS